MAKTEDCIATADNDSTQKEIQCEGQWIIDMIPKAPEFPLPGCCIYRVPKRLREVRKRAYTPRLVAIGPFHRYLRKELNDMENQKLRYFSDFCTRTGEGNDENLACIIQRNEGEIRGCYSEDFRLCSKEFVKMILLDAVFILELFYRKFILENLKTENSVFKSSVSKFSESEKSKAKKDYILRRPCMERGIQHDLLLLENQLPFFILEKLYQNGESNTNEKPTFIELSYVFFGDLYNKQRELEKSCGRVKHFTDLVRYFFLPLDPKQSTPKPVKYYRDLERCFLRPSEPNEENGPQPNQKQEGEKEIELNNRIKHFYYTATKLDEAGLKFITPDSGRSLLEIQFRQNVCLETFPCFNLSWLLSCLPSLNSTCLKDMQPFLEVPRLFVDDKTEGIFRNLIALEQCHYPSETYICDYIVLLDDLITTKADVRLLVEKEIIVNELGSSAAVTKLVNNLALEIELERGKYRYRDLCEELNKYGDSPWNRLVGILTRTYFSDFFKGTATVVGIIVLVLTLWNFSRVLSKV